MASVSATAPHRMRGSPGRAACAANGRIVMTGLLIVEVEADGKLARERCGPEVHASRDGVGGEEIHLGIEPPVMGPGVEVPPGETERHAVRPDAMHERLIEEDLDGDSAQLHEAPILDVLLVDETATVRIERVREGDRVAGELPLCVLVDAEQLTDAA